MEKCSEFCRSWFGPCDDYKESDFRVMGFRCLHHAGGLWHHRIYVAARTASALGAEQVVDFLVAAGEAPVARWHFGEDTAPPTRPATARPTTRRCPPERSATTAVVGAGDHLDRHGTELAVPVTGKLATSGTTGYAAAAGPVLETRSSYTVSAWARLERTRAAPP